MGEVHLSGGKSGQMAFQAAGRLPKSCHRMAANGIPFPWWWDDGTISTNLDVIWGMSVHFD